ncbi:hypothetical protein KAU11_09650 [Candidatus Babeliales bacterium]|nr:hypothetical protein [Candidatus Babeliales bacterium]
MIPLTINTIRHFNKKLDYSLVSNELDIVTDLLEQDFPYVINYPLNNEGNPYVFDAYTKMMYFVNYAIPDRTTTRHSSTQKKYEIDTLLLKPVLNRRDKGIYKRLVYVINLYNHLRANERRLQAFYEYKKGILSNYVMGGVIPVPETYEKWSEDFKG